MVRPGSRARLTIDSGQHKDKNNYDHSFKTLLRVDLGSYSS
jgi:hypothetical protein